MPGGGNLASSSPTGRVEGSWRGKRRLPIKFVRSCRRLYAWPRPLRLPQWSRPSASPSCAPSPSSRARRPRRRRRDPPPRAHRPGPPRRAPRARTLSAIWASSRTPGKS